MEQVLLSKGTGEDKPGSTGKHANRIYLVTHAPHTCGATAP